MKAPGIAAVALLIFFPLCLLGAAHVSGSGWIACLMAAGVVAGLAAVTIPLGIISLCREELAPHACAFTALLASVLACCHVLLLGGGDVFVSTMDMPSLERSAEKLGAMGMWGAAMASLVWGVHGLRRCGDSIAPHVAGALAVAGSLFCLAEVPRILAVAFPPGWACALLIVLAEALWLVERRIRTSGKDRGHPRISG